MGMNAKTGQYAVLTNMRHHHGAPPGPLVSRGEVVQRHLLGQDDEEINRLLREEGNSFKGFNVLYGNALRESQMKAALPARLTCNAPSASGVPGSWRPRTEFVHKNTTYACSNSTGSNQDHWPKVPPSPLHASASTASSLLSLAACSVVPSRSPLFQAAMLLTLDALRSPVRVVERRAAEADGWDSFLG